jgi:hypothetical protein
VGSESGTRTTGPSVECSTANAVAERHREIKVAAIFIVWAVKVGGEG